MEEMQKAFNKTIIKLQNTSRIAEEQVWFVEVLGFSCLGEFTFQNESSWCRNPLLIEEFQ